MNLARAICIAFAYGGFMLLSLCAGGLQAVWLASHGQRAGPLNTVGGVIALAMVALAIPVLGACLVWVAVRAFR